jgi:hypothetical protein
VISLGDGKINTIEQWKRIIFINNYMLSGRQKRRISFCLLPLMHKGENFWFVWVNKTYMYSRNIKKDYYVYKWELVKVERKKNLALKYGWKGKLKNEKTK